MDQNPYQIALARIAEIDARIAAREAANAEDAKEREDWRVAARLFAPQGEHEPIAPPPVPMLADTAVNYREGSVKFLIVQALREARTPWHSANDVQAFVSKLKGDDVPMTTISPSLSDMKEKGVIVRDGLKVALAERANEQPPQFSLGTSFGAPTQTHTREAPLP